MAPPKDRILIVTADSLIADMLARQSLEAAGYRCIVVADVNAAINQSIQQAPDVVIADIKIPGLNAKDLLAALSGQSVQIPMIVLARKGMEADIIQSFRLGASDYLIWPVRETEVINAVERLLRQVHERREREQLSLQLSRANSELQQRVRELTTIYSLGKVVTSVTDPAVLFKKVLDGAIRVTTADLGWLLIQDDAAKAFTLAGAHNLPESLNAQLNRPWDDGISTLVAKSGEALTLFGEPIKRFQIAALGQSALIVPIKVQKQVIGLLVVMRKQAIPFNASEQNLMEAIADYAAISLVNARLFRTLQERARSLEALAARAQLGAKANNGLMLTVQKELRPPLQEARAALDALTKDPTARWNTDQRRQLSALQEQIQHLERIAEAVEPPHAADLKPGAVAAVSDILRQAVQRFKPLAEHNGVSLALELPARTLFAQADAAQLAQILHGLISNAIKFSAPGGSVRLQAAQAANHRVQISVADSGSGLDAAAMARLFIENGENPAARRRFGGLGIGLPLIKELVERQPGSITVESQPGRGTRFHVLFTEIDTLS